MSAELDHPYSHVARAWADPAYKARLLMDANAAIAELGYSGLQGEQRETEPGRSSIRAG